MREHAGRFLRDERLLQQAQLQRAEVAQRRRALDKQQEAARKAAEADQAFEAEQQAAEEQRQRGRAGSRAAEGPPRARAPGGRARPPPSGWPPRTPHAAGGRREAVPRRADDRAGGEGQAPRRRGEGPLEAGAGGQGPGRVPPAEGSRPRPRRPAARPVAPAEPVARAWLAPADRGPGRGRHPRRRGGGPGGRAAGAPPPRVPPEPGVVGRGPAPAGGGRPPRRRARPSGATRPGPAALRRSASTGSRRWPPTRWPWPTTSAHRGSRSSATTGVAPWRGGWAATAPERVVTVTSLATPHPAAMAQVALRSTQVLRSLYIPFFRLPAVPERVLLARGGRLARPGAAAQRARRRAVGGVRRRHARAGGPHGGAQLVPRRLTVRPAALRPVSTGPRSTCGATGTRRSGRAAATATAAHVTGPYRFEELDAAPLVARGRARAGDRPGPRAPGGPRRRLRRRPRARPGAGQPAARSSSRWPSTVSLIVRRARCWVAPSWSNRWRRTPRTWPGAASRRAAAPFPVSTATAPRPSVGQGSGAPSRRPPAGPRRARAGCGTTPSAPPARPCAARSPAPRTGAPGSRSRRGSSPRPAGAPGPAGRTGAGWPRRTSARCAVPRRSATARWRPCRHASK